MYIVRCRAGPAILKLLKRSGALTVHGSIEHPSVFPRREVSFKGAMRLLRVLQIGKRHCIQALWQCCESSHTRNRAEASGYEGEHQTGADVCGQMKVHGSSEVMRLRGSTTVEDLDNLAMETRRSLRRRTS